MKRAILTVCLLFVAINPHLALSQASDASYTGVTLGATRTFWGGGVNQEGYPKAGTIGPAFGLRKTFPVGHQTALALQGQYSYMSATTSLLVSEPYPFGSTRTRYSYFREIDLGLTLQFTPSKATDAFYFGFGPCVRWGQAGLRYRGEDRPGTVYKAAWFGVTVVGGIRTELGKNSLAFIEPQFMFSPDPADRQQKVYPPDNLGLQMGILWR
jgi:hypothetical protein